MPLSSHGAEQHRVSVPIDIDDIVNPDYVVPIKRRRIRIPWR